MLQAATTPSKLGPDAAGAAILARASAPFARRLDPTLPGPVAVGFSGGGDSLALLLAARAWARTAGRPLLALTVDHGLNPQSRSWTCQAETIAAALGVRFQALAWEGDKPRAGLQAAARRARHALLAAAAREAGASVLLLGHTRDDVGEARWMRAQGSSVGSPREWSPSPAWPEGRGVFLLRPFLDVGRVELRQMLAPAGLAWIEDPANDDIRFLRTLARRAAAPGERPPEQPAPEGGFEVDPSGTVRLGRGAAPSLLAMACVCTGGGERPPRREALERLVRRLAAGKVFTATLAGARIRAGDEVLVSRDAGRLGVDVAPLQAGVPKVFDGRFEIIAHGPGLAVRPLGGLMSRLETRTRSALAAFPPSARRALPAVICPDGTVTCPILAQGPLSSARLLVSVRLQAACGRIAREPGTADGSHGGHGSGALS